MFSLKIKNYAKFILKFLGDINPFFYGFSYLICIPIFGLLIHYLAAFEIKNSESVVSDLTSSIYFSAVTITTLGYGDILPNNSLTRLLVIIEASLGVVLAGLFLNSLAYRQSRIIQENEKKEYDRIEYNKRLDKLLAFNKLIELNLKEYEDYVIIMTSPFGSPARPLNEKKPEWKLNLAFKFSDLKHLFKPTGRKGDSFNKSAVEYFYSSLEKLLDSLESALSLDIFADHKDLESEIVNFIIMSRKLDVRDSIFEAFNRKLNNNEPLTKYIENEIGKHTGNEIKLISGNIISPYQILYIVLHQSGTFINNYKKYLKDIEESRK